MTKQPDYFEVAVPEDVSELAERYAKAPDPLTAQHKGWLVVHDPELGIQKVCIIVRTIHLPAR